jgi:hypothetical protein
MDKEKTYNGWKNRQTWSCALWINNDEGLYSAACEWMKAHPKSKRPYTGFVYARGMQDDRNGDNIAWISTRISYSELNAIMRELIA